MKNIHITLDKNLLERLDELGSRLEQSRTSLVREAVVEYVARKEREVIGEQMRQYAEEMGDQSVEFNAWSELETSRMILENTEW